jgi:hypothetical protein
VINLAAGDTIAGVAGTATSVTYSLFGMEFNAGTETYKKLAQGQLGTSAATIYTAAASTTVFLEEARLANATSTAVAGVILYAGGTDSREPDYWVFTIPANGTCIINRSGMAVLDSSGSNYVATTPSNLATSITAASAGINSAETSVVQLTIPANYIAAAGKTFLLTAFGVCTSSAANASNFRARIGTAGTVPITPLPSSRPQLPLLVRLSHSWWKCRHGSQRGLGRVHHRRRSAEQQRRDRRFGGSMVAASLTATVALNTTVQNILQLSYVAAASTTTCTFHGAVIQEVVK